MQKWMWLAALLTGCVYTDSTFDGLDLNVGDPPAVSTGFGRAPDDLTSAQQRQFLVGRALFRKAWSPEVVGPVFNAPACGSCHVDEGRGAANTEALLFRVSTAEGLPHPVYGSQLQPQGLRTAPAEGMVVVTYTTVVGSFADGTTYTLREPTYAVRDLGYGPIGEIQLSGRLAQQIAGLGLLEAIPESAILARADPDDRDEDGISGRAHWVDTEDGRALGRFGWKAGQPSLRHQNAAAFAGDLGMSSSLHPEAPCTDAQEKCLDAQFDPGDELSDDDLDDVTWFTQLATVPAAERRSTRGEALFESTGCADCHTPQWQTGPSSVASLSEVTIRPYTDLLLHDMGEGLADHRFEGDASGVEWRTPPLWGLAEVARVNGHLNLLHDGRARGVAEAILWHGGEATRSREAFVAIPAVDRAALVAFVEGL